MMYASIDAFRVVMQKLAINGLAEFSDLELERRSSVMKAWLRTAIASVLYVLLVAPIVGCLVSLPEVAPPEDTDNLPTQQEIRESLANEPPVANAGEDQDADQGELVVLDATGSTDPDRNRLIFIWTQTDGEPLVDLQPNPFSSIVTFETPAVLDETVLTFQLAIVDGFSVEFDEVAVTVQPAAE